MRNHWIVGAAIAAGGALLIVVGGLLDLEVQTAAWVGLALGAALALVPDRTPGGRLAAAAVGVLAALVGYALRALVLPDSTTGNAIAFLVVIALCTVVVGLAARRLALWASLLGAGAFAGAYEAAFSAAPPEMASTSLTALATLLLVGAVGFLLGSVVPTSPAARRDTRSDDRDYDHSMESFA